MRRELKVKRSGPCCIAHHHAVIHTTVARGKTRQARRTFVSALMIDHVGSAVRQRRDADMSVIHKSSLSSASLDVTAAAAAAAAARAPTSYQIWGTKDRSIQLAEPRKWWFKNSHVSSYFKQKWKRVFGSCEAKNS